MKNTDWELKNLDSLKEYIFNDLIGEHKNTSEINEAINTYAESYHKMLLAQKLEAFVNWYNNLSIEELSWYEGRYVEVFISL